MNNDRKVVVRVDKPYVSDDRIQIMIPYQNSLTLLSKDIVLYHHTYDENVYINKYIEDKCKTDFPYNNIPVHCDIRRFKKVTYANQILNCNEPYVRIVDGNIVETYAIRSDDHALVLNEFVQPNRKEEKMMTRSEIENILNDDKTYVMSLYDGEWFTKDNMDKAFMTEEEIIIRTKNAISQVLNYPLNSFMERYLTKCYNNMTIDDVPGSTPLLNDDYLLLMKIDGSRIRIKSLEIFFMGPDEYKVISRNFPIENHSISEFSIPPFPKVVCANNPRIPLILNKEINREDIKEAKRIVKIFKEDL